MGLKLTLAAAVTLAALAAVAAVTRQARSAPEERSATSPIQHVVIIYQENHSFDDVLGKLCAQAGSSRDPCDGATTGQLHTGETISLSREPDIVPDVLHNVASQQTAINGGAMNGFDLIRGCGSSTGYACYAQYDPSQIPNLAALAQNFAVSDRTFEVGRSPSWGGHLTVAAATLDGFDGDNPKGGSGPGWGCDSQNTAKWWDGHRWTLQPSCVPDQQGQGPYKKSRVKYVPTIFDRVEQAGLTWKLYAGNGKGGGGTYAWTICPSFYECLGSQQSNNFVPSTQVMTDAAAGALPSFAIVTPNAPVSQHNTNSMAQGDNWIGNIVSAIENGPDWSSTAIFIAYDDCGCFYDHVPPPSSDLGIRVPLVIVSPYAKPGYTDSTTASYASMLAYTEHTFGLAPLNQVDGNAYDYANSFNYSKPPRGGVRMTSTGIPASERAWLAAHPGAPDDPT
jgi:phospholipase C